MITQELKDSWLAALRSGEYEQGRHQFKTPEGKYCCLGVLCMVMKHPEWIGVRDVKSDNYRDLRDGSNLARAETEALCFMNDPKTSSFDQIADYIKAYIDVAEPASTQTP